MQNFITYNVALVPENSAVIDAINELLIGSKTLKSEAPAEKPKAEKPAPKKEASVESGTTADEFKEACKAAKKEHGEEFTLQVMKDAGVKVTTKLGTSITKVDAEMYDSIMQDWVDGPVTEAASDDLEDDGFDDDDDLEDEAEAEVSAEAVKIALKAYSKDVGRAEAKEIMTSNGAAALSKVDDCTPAQLAAMMKAMV